MYAAVWWKFYGKTFYLGYYKQNMQYFFARLLFSFAMMYFWKHYAVALLLFFSFYVFLLLKKNYSVNDMKMYIVNIEVYYRICSLEGYDIVFYTLFKL